MCPNMWLSYGELGKGLVRSSNPVMFVIMIVTILMTILNQSHLSVIERKLRALYFVFTYISDVLVNSFLLCVYRCLPLRLATTGRTKWRCCSLRIVYIHLSILLVEVRSHIKITLTLDGSHQVYLLSLVLNFKNICEVMSRIAST